MIDDLKVLHIDAKWTLFYIIIKKSECMSRVVYKLVIKIPMHHVL